MDLRVAYIEGIYILLTKLILIKHQFYIHFLIYTLSKKSYTQKVRENTTVIHQRETERASTQEFVLTGSR